MKALFNNKIVEESLLLPFNDRALQFGDGLFETIIVTNKSASLLPYHLKRVKKGASSLGLKIGKKSTLEEAVLKVVELNDLNKYARVKLQVWRKATDHPGYSPGSSDANVLVTAYDYAPQRSMIKANVGFSEDVSLHYSKYSRFKTLNSLPYIYASIERDKKGLDDLILMDRLGHVSECISSNVFWVKDGIYYSPSLRTGCVEGVMRNFVIDQLKERGVKFKKVLATKHELLEADTVFSANVTGIATIKSIEGKSFSGSLELPF